MLKRVISPKGEVTARFVIFMSKKGVDVFYSFGLSSTRRRHRRLPRHRSWEPWPYFSLKRAVTSFTNLSWRSLGRRLIVHPPKPPPIILEPVTPSSLATSLRKSRLLAYSLRSLWRVRRESHTFSGHSLIVAGVECVAHCKHSLFLLDHEFGAEEVFSRDVCLDFIQASMVASRRVSMPRRFATRSQDSRRLL